MPAQRGGNGTAPNAALSNNTHTPSTRCCTQPLLLRSTGKPDATHNLHEPTHLVAEKPPHSNKTAHATTHPSRHTPPALRQGCWTLRRVSTDWTTQDGAGGGLTGHSTSTPQRCQCVPGPRVLCGGHAASHQQGRKKGSGWVVWSKNGRRKTLRVSGWTNWTNDQQGKPVKTAAGKAAQGIASMAIPLSGRFARWQKGMQLPVQA